MAEEIARYNVVLELLTELKNAEAVPKAVSGMKKEFTEAQLAFKNIISNDIVKNASDGIAKLRSHIGELGNSADVKPLLDRIDELSKKTELTSQEFIELEKISKQLGEVLGNAINDAAFDPILQKAVDFQAELKATQSEIASLEDLINSGLLTGIELQEAITRVNDLKKGLGSASKEVGNVRKEFVELKKQIQSGNLTGEELEQAKKRAGELANQIGDASAQINKLASNTRGLDTLLETTRLLAAGFAIAKGAAALFGEENEEVQKALVKLNAIMVIQNSLKEIDELLLRNSNIALAIKTQLTKADTAATGAAVFVTKLWSKSVDQTSTSFKFLKGAIISTGIGLLLVLLGTLIANWDRLSKSIDENAKSLFAFGKSMAIILPPLSALISGIEFLYNNFNNLKFAIYAIPEALSGLGKAIGDVFAELGDLDFSGAISAFFDIGEKFGKAFDKGYQNAVQNDINKQIEKLLEGSIKIQTLYADRLDALEQDSYKTRKAIIEQTIQSLELQGKKEQEIYEQRTKLIELEKDHDKYLEAQRKKRLDDALEEINAQFARNEQAIRIIKAEELLEAQSIVNREERAKKILEVQESLNGELERNEKQHQLAISEKRIEFLEKGTADYEREQNKILEIKAYFNNEFLRDEEVFFEDLGKFQSKGVAPIIEQLKTDLTKLKDQYKIITDPRLKEQVGKQIEELNKEIRKFNSPFLNKELFVNEGFDAIDITQILPDQQIQALKDRLKLIGNAQKNLKDQLKNGQLDASELLQSDKLDAEANKIIEILGRLSGEFKKGLLGLSEEDFALINESINLAKDAYDTISEIFKSNLDERIALQEDRVSKAEKIAEKGNVRQLELEEERLQKLEEEREKAASRAALLQKAFAQAEIVINTAQTISALQLAAAKTAATTGVAAPITVPIVLAIVGGLIATAANLFKPPSFIEGIEQVNKAPQYNQFKRHNGQDGYTANFDGRERILSPSQNEAIGNLSNPQLVEAALMYKNPNMWQMTPMVDTSRLGIGSNSNSTDYKELKMEMQLIRESIDNNKTKIIFDKNGLQIAIEKYFQGRTNRERYKA